MKDNAVLNAGTHWRPSDMGKTTAVKRAERKESGTAGRNTQ